MPKKKHTIEEMHELAKRLGGKCLSKEYVNWDTKLLWECGKCGYRWEAIYQNVKNGHWCPKCAGQAKPDIKEAHEIAKKHGGICHSNEYFNSKTKLLFECKYCHKWGAVMNVIKHSWCPECAGKIKRTINDCKNIAKKFGGDCISNIDGHITVKTILRWKCKNNHEWESKLSNILVGSWCHQCNGGVSKYTIENMQSFAKKHGGLCLSTEYVNNSTELEWQCQRGHRWFAIPANIIRGSWCKKCAGKEKYTIGYMQELARANSGICVTNSYKNNKTKLIWRCREGHEFFNTPNEVINGAWCNECNGIKRYKIEDMQKFAKQKNGECLSTEYINYATKLLWKCEHGHIWETTPANIVNGKWCPHCAGIMKLSIDDMKQLAKERGGECISETYINNRTKLIWKCRFGHVWKASADKIKFGKWCPYCNTGLGERLCRELFEQLFAVKFDRAYPKWLKSDTGSRLELDGYNETLGIAFEHNGEQHYSANSHWIPNNEKLNRRKELDKLKKKLCIKNNVKLISIPEIPTRLQLSDLKNFVIKKCVEFGIKLPENYSEIEINYNKAYMTNRTDEMYFKLKEVIESRGGKLISEFYVNNKSKVTVKCEHSHIFKSTPSDLKQGKWCMQCAINKRKKNNK